MFAAAEVRKLREEVRSNNIEINKNLYKTNSLLDTIKPSEKDLKIKELENENKILHELNNTLQGNLNSSKKVIDDLMGYINKIPEVQLCGGIRTSIGEYQDFATCKDIKYERIHIPELVLLKAIGEDGQNE